MQHWEQEHRRHGRYRRETPALLDFHDAAESCNATTLDLSREGASFHARARVRLREPVLLRLQLDQRTPPLEAKAKVCWATPHPDGTHEFGVRFLDLTDEEQSRLGHFLDDTVETRH